MAGVLPVDDDGDVDDGEGRDQEQEVVVPAPEAHQPLLLADEPVLQTARVARTRLRSWGCD